ncbi:hypothetical protein PPL_08506 [Heterostelium album PN500]|uniref:COI1 F-box domain-containing protein n=1 Tax=Heterostelium pallidum (strain ATCC 26659 / Pp 5 / PN500) TaxID=670386 RepID=D3BID6_HETP5|nr:hypothetical protein PPL_08506 [Heterostelium album PN500]EFA79036.1 hypothetical protein PPL_08506 [Heterostelium album PN500]|eukprot:XP_020431159.1 hypothetical protein PPL_08506 [Heterostelium album PN500]
MIVDLSHLLLSKIISYLEDNIDRICVSLVCKRWFDERDKYLYFNTDNIKMSCFQEEDRESDFRKSVFTLESYRSLLFRSFNQKSNCTLSYGYGCSISYDTDYSIDLDRRKTNDKITPNITKVFLETNEELGKKETEILYGMISNSNVFNLKEIASFNSVCLSSVLPANLTSITFHEFNESLLAGYLPPKLEKLKFEWESDFNEPILAGVLPNTLKKLKFAQYFNKTLEPHVLPSSLTYLKLGGEYTQTLQVGSLPPNLRVLIHKGKSKISDGVLPESLCTLASHFKWIPFIKSLNNLTTLTLLTSGHDSIDTIYLSDLPDSLTSLDIQTSCRLASSLSPSIKYLDIHSTTDYDIDEIFKDRSQYHFERLCVDGNKQESLDNLKIKELHLEFDLEFGNSESILRYIPYGVETLYFGNGQFKFAEKDRYSIPLSVRKIICQYYNTINLIESEIPNSVEEVVIKYFSRSEERFTDNIDRICVSLVCKRWFNERDKYLYFNTDRIKMYNFQEYEENDNCKSVFSLKSYRSSTTNFFVVVTNIYSEEAFKCKHTNIAFIDMSHS